jgi:hypothetical protein
MPSFLFAVLVFFTPEALQPMSGRVMMYVLMLIFITTFIIPVFSLIGLKTSGTISSFRLVRRQERILPFILITIFYGITTFLFYSKIQVNNLLMAIFVGATLVVALITIITIFIKISVHSVGAGCIVGYIFGFNRLYPGFEMILILTIAIVLSGAILSSRLYLKAHTPKEAYMGFVLGLVISYLTLYGYI